MNKSTLVYIAAQVPYGRGETFITEEMLAMKRAGINLLIIPRNPQKKIFHKEAKELFKNAIWLPLINIRIIINFLKMLLTKTFLWKILRTLIRDSRNPWVLIKNLIVFPKGVFITKVLQKEKIEHIHAHWGSTTSTMAYIASQFTGIPWSFTLHRWDIKENNMLKEKVKSAKFVRCISEYGKNELIEIIGREYQEKIKVIHMGVKIPECTSEFEERNIPQFIVVTPANLLEVKGHKYLIEACSILIKQDIKNFQCIFCGEGPLRTELENLIKERKLINYIKMPGAIPHEKIMEMYKNQEIHTVVLPSITTDKGEHEGIPVALMEAMSYGVPVISTAIGGIPELIRGESGIMVKEKNAKAIADGIEKLMLDKRFYFALSLRERKKILREFNIKENVENLLSLFEMR